MDQLQKEIRLSYIGDAIERLHRKKDDNSPAFTFHFNQNEELFLKLSTDFTVPSFRIHHDVRNMNPDALYIENLEKVLVQLNGLCPQILDELSCYFDPTEIFKPCFYTIERMDGNDYLYLLRIDLSFRPALHTVLSQSDNDSTPEYKTSLLFVECDYFPVEHVVYEHGVVSSFSVRQVVSNTWIGERGRGYSVQGIWIDRDLSRFLSMLFIPREKRMYPYFPFTCKHKTLCLSPVQLSPAGRDRFLPFLDTAYRFIVPHMELIEQDLRNNEFSEALPSYQTIKNQIPSSCRSMWDSYTMNVYINEHDRKEWRLDFPYR